MSEHRHVTEPGEMIYAPAPSWGPILFAAGVVGLVAGIFAAGFIFSPYVYSVFGAVIVLLALRSMAKGATRTFFRLPRRQRVQSAALPIEQIVLEDPVAR